VYAAGHLFAVQGGVLAARPFDARRLVPTGKTVAIASGVASWTNASSWGWFSASTSGRLVWVSERDTAVRLEWLDREGNRLGTLGDPGRYSQIALSPDGRRVAVEVKDADGRFDIWLIDVARGVASRLTSDPANERDPVWSPDGQEVVFSSDRGGDQNLLRKSLQESEPAAPLPRGAGATSAEDDVAESWSRVGNTLLYLTLGEQRTVWALPLDRGAPAERLMQGRFAVDEPHVSLDGRWLAYVSTESGRHEVYVEPFQRRGETVRVSKDGGGQPRWRDDGKELFYLSLDGRLMAVSIREGATGPEVGAPTTLVPADRLRAVVQGPDYDDYAVTADGQRFLVKRPAGEGQRQRIHVVLDWPSRLK
jgi:Tol biopolymer transport system component